MNLRKNLMAVIQLFVLAVISTNTTAAMTIAQVKMSPDGTEVNLTAKSVSFAQTDLFYIEEEDRSCGLLVAKPDHKLAAGFKADVTGTMKTNADGERYIDGQTALRAGSEFERINPLLVNCKSIGGSDWHYDPNTGAGQRGIDNGTGLNNIGLLVKVAGNVTYVDRVNGIAYIDDGSALTDGNTLVSGCSAAIGVRVILPPGTSMSQENSSVQFVGVVSTTCVNDVMVPVLKPSSYTGEMQYIPAGTFMMGNTGLPADMQAIADYSYNVDELPAHEVTISAGFWLGKYEVTRGEYRQFINAGGYWNSAYWSETGWQWRLDNDKTEPLHWSATVNWGTPPGEFTQTEWHPVVGVSWYESEAFCKWAGGHLPTEAQWEWSIRGDDTPTIYLWGNDWRKNVCNNYYDNLSSLYETMPVGTYSGSVSVNGCYDMAGNVWEWCQDWYDPTYYSSSPKLDPTGPATGYKFPEGSNRIDDMKVIRSGSWFYGSPDMRADNRYHCEPGSYAHFYGGSWRDVGIRLARP